MHNDLFLVDLPLIIFYCHTDSFGVDKIRVFIINWTAV